jgi:hypothetical protein
MRFVVTFNDTGTEGVMVFTANDMEDAVRFISNPANFYRPDRVSAPVPFSGNIADLYKMFPLKKREHEKS